MKQESSSDMQGGHIKLTANYNHVNMNSVEPDDLDQWYEGHEDILAGWVWTNDYWMLLMKILLEMHFSNS